MKISRFAPVWLVNGPIDKNQTDAELTEIRSKSIDSFVLAPAGDWAANYLTEEWFQVVGWAIESAAALGLTLWLREDVSSPSGSAGGLVQLGRPEFENKFLQIEAAAREDIDLLFFEPGQFLVAARLQGGQATRTRVLPDIHSLKALDSNWHVLNCRLRRDENHVDALSTAAAKRFIELTHEEYYSRFSSSFGTTIAGFVAAAPAILRGNPNDTWLLPYTEELFPSFEEHFRYPAVPNIPYLFFPGHDARAFRADFWQHVSSMFNLNHYTLPNVWCWDHRVKRTGYTASEEPLRGQVQLQGDLFGALSQMDVPAVDHTGRATSANRGIAIVGHKAASSSAHTSGKPVVQSESFGCSGWDATYLDLKKIVDWQFALGVNSLSPHALFHSVAGRRKQDCPPSFFIQSPLWQDFETFRSYVDRVSEHLTGGRHICRVAILYPLTGMFASYQPDRKTEEFEALDSVLNLLCVELMKRQLDFDMLDFSTLCDARPDVANKLTVADEIYDVLLIPYTPYMHPKEYETIGALSKRVDTYFFYRSGDPAAANVPGTTKGVNFVATEELPGFIMRLRHAIDDGVHISGHGREDILLLQREKEGRRIAFIVNQSSHPRKISARFSVSGGLRVIEPETGASLPIHVKRDDKSELDLHLHPYQSVLVVADGEDSVPDRGHAKTEEMLLQVSAATSDNVALLQFDSAGEARFHAECEGVPLRLVLDRSLAGRAVAVNGIEVVPAPAKDWLVDPSDLSADVTALVRSGANVVSLSPSDAEPVRIRGDFDVAPGDHTVLRSRGQRNPFRLEESMPFYSGTVSYTAAFDLDEMPRHAQLRLGPVHDAASVTVNGRAAGKRLWAPYDFEITQYLAPGRNEILIEVRNSPANLILGSGHPFGLRETPKVEISR